MAAEKNAPEAPEETTNNTTTPTAPAPEEPATPPSMPSPPLTENESENEKPASLPEGPKIRMRQKTPITAPKLIDDSPLEVGNAAAAIKRTMENLYEVPPEMEDNNEEIRKLDSQLDKLNDYMDRVEERLKQHNTRLTQMLKEQKEEREKRRQSFHERMQANRQEDDEFQNQLAALLNKVDMSRKRATVIEHGTDS